MDNDLLYKISKPAKPLSDFVDSFWMLHNQSDENKETIGLPDGRIDLSLYTSAHQPFRMVLLGLGTQHMPAVVPARARMFVLSFKLLAAEYILQESIAGILNYGKILPDGFWDFSENDLLDFEAFVAKATQKIQSLLPAAVDERKHKLFDLIYTANGNITVKELSAQVYWSSRQINRYFNQYFGLSLKAFCNILRFRYSLEQVARGELFPEDHFTDQNHFIKEIKKFSGVVPKELSKNKNDRFILLSTLPPK